MTAVPAKLYTVVVLFNAGRVLLLHRASWKSFAPNRWTGIGGRVESAECGDLEAAARRELAEETDLRPDEISLLTLRRTLTFYSADEGLVTLVYFTGETTTDRIPSSNEGSLAWVEPSRLDRLDLIENTGRVLRVLIDDARRGDREISCGVARLDQSGTLLDVIFA